MVLEYIIKHFPNDYKASYYLGNLWYDKRQYNDAIDCWEQSAAVYDGFPTVHRNLGIAYFNRFNDPKRALAAFEKSFHLDTTDARVLFELDRLYKRLNYPVAERLGFLKKHFDCVIKRDDLYLEYVTLLNISGALQQAAEALAARKFHPWEGGEGKVIKQYMIAKTGLAKNAMREGSWSKALELLDEAESYPENLGEGKLPGTTNNDLDFWKGLACAQLKNHSAAEEYWHRATSGKTSLQTAVFYNDAPPDVIFYQGLALDKLHRQEEAAEKFYSLIQYAKEHIDDEVEIDYFAVSLPGLMIFDDDLKQRNKIHCHYLLALVLGKPGDFSAPVSYEVTAANGNKKSWVISVAPLPVVNQWEGLYIESGTLTHSTAGLQTAPANYQQELITAGPNKLKATGGFWYFNNPGITYFITINPDNSVTISADPNAAVVVQQDTNQASTYDPATKTFRLYYYYYSGGSSANWRRFQTVFTLKP